MTDGRLPVVVTRGIPKDTSAVWIQGRASQFASWEGCTRFPA